MIARIADSLFLAYTDTAPVAYVVALYRENDLFWPKKAKFDYH